MLSAALRRTTHFATQINPSRAYATTAKMTDPSKYKLNHSMLRVKDPKASVAFYEHLGMKLVNQFTFPDNKFDLYFLAYDSPRAVSHGNHWTDREGIIELTHNYGTENDPNYKSHNGNREPKGFGHVCISVDNIQAACQRLTDAGYKFQKRLEDGRMRHIAFALDPDEYWVEIIAQNPVEATENVTTTDLETYRMNHTMIRVKDKDASLKFYQDVLGMKLMRTAENPSAEFNLYFLGYGEAPAEGRTAGLRPRVCQCGRSECGVSEVSPALLSSLFDEKGVNWKKRLTDGRMRNVAFVLDPDDYWIEVIQSMSTFAFCPSMIASTFSSNLFCDHRREVWQAARTVLGFGTPTTSAEGCRKRRRYQVLTGAFLNPSLFSEKSSVLESNALKPVHPSSIPVTDILEKSIYKDQGPEAIHQSCFLRNRPALFILTALRFKDASSAVHSVDCSPGVRGGRRPSPDSSESDSTLQATLHHRLLRSQTE
ncbi:lactoylglutathione lyase-like protein [Hortaea werneckii]|nr:lactoylglutathione lyase-like protein [Hortaea werneckii]